MRLKIDNAAICIFIAVVLVIIVALFTKVYGDGLYSQSADYFNEIWQKKHVNGVSEYIIQTDILSNDVEDYVNKHHLKKKKFVYVKKNKKGKITKCIMCPNLNETVKVRNKNGHGNKKLKRFTYKGKGKKFNQNWKAWKKGDIWDVMQGDTPGDMEPVVPDPLIEREPR